MKLFIAFTVLMSFSAFAAPKKCVLEVKDTVRMPNGPMDFPATSLGNLQKMGYSPKLVSYPSSTPGNYSLEVEVTCGNLIFNPWISNCSTVMSIFDADATLVAQGTADSQVAIGVYSADLTGAMSKLPTCAKLK